MMVSRYRESKELKRGAADGLSPSSIISFVASATGVRTIDIRSDRRTKALTLARHVAMWLARRETLLSYPMIRYAFGRRDHTTVMHAVRRIDRMMGADPVFAAQVLALARAIMNDHHHERW